MDIRTYFNQRAAHWDDGEQSVDQIRRMIAFLSDIQEGMSVLDVACGTGAMFEALRERKPSHITTVDLSEKMIEIAARKVEGDSLFEDSGTYKYSFGPKLHHQCRICRRSHPSCCKIHDR